MKKHYKTGGGGYFAPANTTKIVKDYQKHKLAQGIVLMPANLNTASRSCLVRIIRDQATLIAELRTRGEQLGS